MKIAIVKCPHCGHETDSGNSTCGECGRVLGIVQTADYPQPPYVQQAPSKKGFSTWSAGKKITLILIVIFCFLAAGYITYKTVRHIAHLDLKLDKPPAGYEQLTGEQFEEVIADFKEAEPDTALDAFYVGGDGYRQVFLAHQNTKDVVIFTFGKSGIPPDTKDLSEMERFVMENRIEIEKGLQDLYENLGVKSESIIIDSFQLENDGSCGIHTTARIQRSDDTLVQDYLRIYRNDIAYGATAQNQLGESNSEEVEYLLRNLYFE